MVKTEQPIYPVKITVLKKLKIEDLFDKYAKEDFESECPIFRVGEELIAKEDYVPEGFCRWAWADIFRGIIDLSYGGDYPHINQKGVMVSAAPAVFDP